MRVFKRGVSVFFFVASILGVVVTISDQQNLKQNIAPIAISLVLGILFWRSSNKQPKPKKIKKEQGTELHGVMHIEGLPIAEKTKCRLELLNDHLLISGGGTEFSIKLSQIGAAEVKTDVEIAHIVSSSAAKGVAGGLLFGPIGLVVGSRVKSKEKRTTTPYLIINYTNSVNELSALMFEAGLDPWSLTKFLKKLQSVISNNPKQQVQL